MLVMLQPLAVIIKQPWLLTFTLAGCILVLMTNPVEKLISLAGGQSALARRQNVKQQSVWKWLQKGEVSPLRAIRLEADFPGIVSKYDLCPELRDAERVTRRTITTKP